MSPKADVSTERKQQIYQAALACFNRKGYHLTTMDDIVIESGLSKGALYWYFDSKKALFISLLGDFMSPMGQEWEAIAADPAMTADVLRLANSAGFITGKRVKNINLTVEPGQRVGILGATAHRSPETDQGHSQHDGDRSIFEQSYSFEHDHHLKILVGTIGNCRLNGVRRLSKLSYYELSEVGALGRLSIYLCSGHLLRFSSKSVRECCFAGGGTCRDIYASLVFHGGA